MTTTKAAPLQTVKALTDDPTIEAQSVRGLLYGFLFAALFWLIMAALTFTLL